MTTLVFVASFFTHLRSWNHLKSDGFFDIVDYPTVMFQISKPTTIKVQWKGQI